MNTKLLFILTRTPLHVGAGVIGGLVDRPVLRERHTGHPVIPGTTLKGVFATEWSEAAGETGAARNPEGAWLFGTSTAGEESGVAGAMQFTEARLLAFPIRSARGSFAWITSPLILRRFARDGGLKGVKGDGTVDFDYLPRLEPRESQAVFAKAGPLALGEKAVLEDYAFTHLGELPGGLLDCLKAILPLDPVWSEIVQRLVIVSDGMLAFFAQSACEFTHRATVDDLRGVVAPGRTFSQENVPSETMFYACLNFFAERSRTKPKGENRAAEAVFTQKLEERRGVFQFGADASTGLGYCSVALRDPVS